LFCVIFLGGFIANSLAVLNDALHQIFDLNSLLMSLAAAWISSWKPNDKKTYGYFRAGTNNNKQKQNKTKQKKKEKKRKKIKENK
jgi:hypothetical protein